MVKTDGKPTVAWATVNNDSDDLLLEVALFKSSILTHGYVEVYRYHGGEHGVRYAYPTPLERVELGGRVESYLNNPCEQCGAPESDPVHLLSDVTFREAEAGEVF